MSQRIPGNLLLASLILFCALASGGVRAQGVAPSATPSPAGPAWTDTIPGHPGTYYFYRGYDYGSMSLVHPLRMIVNGGFGILQISNRDNRLQKIMYGRGARNVARNLLDPFWSINVNGWWDFFSREVVPISVASGDSQYWPNYMNHLLGGGMGFRMMEEYYRYHGVDHARTWAGITLFVYHYLNETVENNDYLGPTTDPVADMWIFNPAGMMLFSNDRVARFFSETLHMTDWSYQPMLMVDTGELQNMGQNYIIKWHLNARGSTSLFYQWGNLGLLGLSFRRDDGRALSVGFGFVAKNLLKVDRISKTVDLAVSGGLFYDRNNSLLASLQLSRTPDYRYRLNLYPGLVRAGPFKPGLFAALDEDNRVKFGITIGTLRHLPVGFGYRDR